MSFFLTLGCPFAEINLPLGDLGHKPRCDVKDETLFSRYIATHQALPLDALVPYGSDCPVVVHTLLYSLLRSTCSAR